MASEIKTIAQWISELPPSLRKPVNPECRNLKVNSLYLAVLQGFNWRDSDEGEEFWDAFTDALLWAEPSSN